MMCLRHTETLRQYFCRYGDVVDCMVMKDPTTKRSRYYNLQSNAFSRLYAMMTEGVGYRHVNLLLGVRVSCNLVNVYVTL